MRSAPLLALAIMAATHAHAQTPVPAAAASAARQDVPVLDRGLGTVQAYYSVLVRARVDGTLDSVAVAEGQEVRKGDILATIDPRPYRATLAQTVAKRAADVATLANAQADLKRYAALATSQFASRQSVDTQQAAVAQSQAAIEGDDAAIQAAQLNVDFCDIRSPIDGRVGLRQVDPGNLIHATDQQGILTVTQVHPIAVVFTLPQDSLAAVQTAMRTRALTATALTSDGATVLGSGTLLTPDNAIDSTTGTIKLKAVFPNDDRRLWPGQFVNVDLLVDTRRNALVVPSAAVQHGPDGLYVYRVKADDTVERVPVTIGEQNDGVTVVLSGIADGDRVVTQGQSRLQAGTKVSLANEGQKS